MTKKKQLNPFLKLALEMGPLLLFFFANSRPALFMPLVGPLLPEAVSGEKAGIFVATAVFIVAILVSLAVSYALTRHLPADAAVATLCTAQSTTEIASWSQQPARVVGVSVVTALLPAMSAHATTGRFDLLRADLSHGLRLAGTIVVPAALTLAAR